MTRAQNAHADAATLDSLNAEVLLAEGKFDELLKRLDEACAGLPYSFELILVNDGSNEETTALLNTLAAQRNDNEFSVMTYASYLGSPTAGASEAIPGSSPQSYMMYDIAALQALYGANFSKAGTIGHAPAIFASGSSSVSVDLAIDVKAAARLARIAIRRSATASAADLAGALYAPAGKIVRLANDGLTLRASSHSRTVLVVGRTLGKSGTSLHPGWNARISIDW